MGMKFASEFIGALLVNLTLKSQLFKLGKGVLSVGHLRATLFISPHNGLRAEGEDISNLMLRGWVVSFRTGVGVGGSRLHGIIESLPAVEIVARGISGAELVHVCFELVRQVGEVVSWIGVGVSCITVAFVRGLQRKPVELLEVVEGIPGIWKCNVRGVHECCSACAGISPLIANDAKMGFNVVEMNRVRGALQNI
eukprot:1138514-Pelagomonas_calceolata.AAC.1